tara:strand:- start:590 stop:1042 length:453 start_codon:yes stop_codon:yes gene_type:complete
MAAPIKYKLKEGAITATVSDELSPMIQRLIRETLPDLERLVLDKYLEPIYREAFRRWPVASYDKQRTSRRGGASKAALAYDVKIRGTTIKGRIYNDAEYNDRFYAYIIYWKGKSSTRRVWDELVKKPFRKAARQFSDDVALMLRDIARGS